MTRKKMAIIGCGKMASAMVLGMPKGSLEFFGYNPTLKKAQDLMASVVGTAIPSLKDLPTCDFYLIGAKPQHFKELAQSFSPPKESTIISLMAGITMDTLMRGFNSKKVIRLMPNTPCLVGEGVVGLIASKGVENLSFITDLLKNTGLVQVVDNEELINIITAFTGSGPAYIFELANILSDLMVERGLDQEVAQKLIVQMIKGSGVLMSKSSESPRALRDNVTSKGGTTEAALNVFKTEGLRAMVSSAIAANLTRAKELEGESK
ncbi:MAG: pyrroline-5-carboxylate reductase [Deltaproteobacteria bacterium]|nr:MAG: pyrroline-5-carboxylate reductase [Deltaproteobacteria bacterium]